MLHETFGQITHELVDACREVYRDRLEGVVVFGSVATGRMRPDSDVDVLVVAAPLPAGRLPRMEEFAGVDRRLDPLLEDARRRGFWTRISPLVYTPHELDHLGFVLFDIAIDGMVAYDRDGSVASKLEAVRRRLRERGAQRRVGSTGRYWVLDPDVKPGQVVVI